MLSTSFSFGAEEGKVQQPERPASGGADKKWRDQEEETKGLLPEDTWTAISPAFYLTFWALKLEDLYVPKDM